MTTFTIHTPDNAPAASKAGLNGARAAFGFVPNLQATMAESPELLAGYSTLWGLFAETSLTPHEQQVVMLTSNFENECHYCMAACRMRSRTGCGADVGSDCSFTRAPLRWYLWVP